MNIKDLQKECYRISKEHGWWEEKRNIGEVIALMHSELSEALEEWRKSEHEVTDIYFSPGMTPLLHKPEGFGIELADCIIRILDNAEDLGIDIAECLKLKMAYNETRPYRHGNKRA